MKPIIIIRHAEPTDCSWHVGTHWVDCALTEKGRRQAECLAARLKVELAGAPVRIWSSDLRRARQTAEPVARELGVEIQTTADLREFHNGVNAGTEEEIKRFVDEMTPPTVDLRARPEGESWPEFYLRAAGRMQQLYSDGDDRQTLVFAHFGTICQMFSWWLQPDRNENSETKIGFGASLASIAVLTQNGQGKRALERVNDTAHLYAAGLAPQIPRECR
jgi:broad specificity phosphatase PhoE